MWKSACLALGFSLAAAPAFAADTLKFEADHTYAMFSYSHFGMSRQSGKIMGATGTLTLDAEDPTKDAVDIALS